MGVSGAWNIGSMTSGILLSRTVFAFLGNRPLQAVAQTVHMLCAYWVSAILSLHLGLHWGNILNMAERLFNKRSAARKWVIRVIGWLIAAYGIYAFIKRYFAGYMFLQTHFVFFDLDEPLILYLLDYLAVMGAFVCTGNYLAVLLRKVKSSNT